MVHPDLEDMRGVIFEAILDSRALDSLIGDGEEGAACAFVTETLGIEGDECGEPAPGRFCLPVAAHSIVARHLPEVSLEAVGCADVIDRELAGTCEAGSAAAYDADEDGTWELCPAWTP